MPDLKEKQLINKKKQRENSFDLIEGLELMNQLDELGEYFG